MKHDPDFEREKWRVETELRQRELSLRERDQANRDAELDLKRKELAGSKWRSPLVVAIFAATVAALGNAGVTFVNGMLQRDLENAKSDAELRVEESKAESSRILEMIKTGNTDDAAKNLTFLLDTALVSDPKRAAKLRAFLSSRAAPVLPPISQSGPDPLKSFKSRENRDFEGHDLRKFPSSDLNTCASECEGNSQCQAFSFDHLNRYCFLKDGVPDALQLNPGNTVGVRQSLELPTISTAPVAIALYSNRRIVDQPTDVKTTANKTTCQASCANDIRCVGFNFFKETKSCELFSSILGVERGDNTVDSGIKRQLPSPR
jgi:hypothetical protein